LSSRQYFEEWEIGTLLKCVEKRMVYEDVKTSITLYSFETFCCEEEKSYL
jgi:hypothetical protein